MPGAPVLLMIAVMALAAFISFAAPTRLRARLRLRDWDSETPQKSLMAARVDPAADGLRDTAMMLELVARCSTRALEYGGHWNLSHSVRHHQSGNHSGRLLPHLPSAPTGRLPGGLLSGIRLK